MIARPQLHFLKGYQEYSSGFDLDAVLHDVANQTARLCRSNLRGRKPQDIQREADAPYRLSQKACPVPETHLLENWRYDSNIHVAVRSGIPARLRSEEEDFLYRDAQRGIERDNAASRLWWQATLCNRVKDIKLEDSLQCLLHDTDVRASIIERPTTSQCLNVFCAIIKKLHESYKGDKKLINRHSFRPLMKSLNLHGGIKLLNAMEESDIIKFIDDFTSCTA